MNIDTPAQKPYVGKPQPMDLSEIDDFKNLSVDTSYKLAKRTPIKAIKGNSHCFLSQIAEDRHKNLRHSILAERRKAIYKKCQDERLQSVWKNHSQEAQKIEALAKMQQDKIYELFPVSDTAAVPPEQKELSKLYFQVEDEKTRVICKLADTITPFDAYFSSIKNEFEKTLLAIQEKAQLIHSAYKNNSSIPSVQNNDEIS